MVVAVRSSDPPALDRSLLTPVQQWAYDGVLHVLPAETAVMLYGKSGSGSSTVARALHAAVGGAFLTPRDFIGALRSQHPLAMEETLTELVRSAFEEHDTVFLGDMNLVQPAMFVDANPRAGLLSAPLAQLIALATATGKKLVFDGDAPCQLRPRCFPWWIQPFQVADYAVLLSAFLGESVTDGIDVGRIFKFAPHLDAHQLRNTCIWVGRRGTVTTEQVIEFVQTHHIRNNVDLDEVQEVEFQDLKGLDDLLDSLETHIILPLENDALAAELQLRPKRGVLLAGPPGTGKTTLGRVLARRLGKKFFLIDGSIIAGTHNFYQQIEKIFETAKESGDCIIFIDDSDVIFEEGKETGLYRYLLTMLDGLESKSAGRICVMMTAMKARSLPPALVRSGRIELWLETRLPDTAARRAILEHNMAPVREALGDVDAERVAAEAEGLTGADLKRIVEDGKLFLARDRAEGRPIRATTEYMLTAVAALRAHRERYLARIRGFTPRTSSTGEG